MDIRHNLALLVWGVMIAQPIHHVLDFVFFGHISSEWTSYALSLIWLTVWGFVGLWIRSGVSYKAFVSRIFVSNTKGFPLTRAK